MRAEDTGALVCGQDTGPARRLHPGLAGQAVGLDAGCWGNRWGEAKEI